MTSSNNDINNDIYEVCGYIGPTLVEDPKSDTSSSYLDVTDKKALKNKPVRHVLDNVSHKSSECTQHLIYFNTQPGHQRYRRSCKVYLFLSICIILEHSVVYRLIK